MTTERRRSATTNADTRGDSNIKRSFLHIPIVVPAATVKTAVDRLARTLHERMVSLERESRALAFQ